VRGERRAGRLAALVACAALAFLAACAGGAPPRERAPPPGADFRLASYNVHYLDLKAAKDAPWGLADWTARRAPLVEMVRRIGADILALQEVEVEGGAPGQADLWQDWLDRALPGYRAAGVRLDNGVRAGQPLFYRPGAFRVLDDGFAFCPNPGARFRSIRAIAGYPDAVTWARFRHLPSGRNVMVFNVHLHFLDGGQRLRSARQILALAKAAQWRGDAVFLIGDFNARRNSRPLRIFHDKGFRRTPGRGATFHFDAGLHLFGAIDHLLHGPKTVPLTRAVAERGRIGGTWPSDHYPVWADYRFAP